MQLPPGSRIHYRVYNCCTHTRQWPTLAVSHRPSHDSDAARVTLIPGVLDYWGHTRQAGPNWGSWLSFLWAVLSCFFTRDGHGLRGLQFWELASSPRGLHQLTPLSLMGASSPGALDFTL